MQLVFVLPFAEAGGLYGGVHPITALSWCSSEGVLVVGDGAGNAGLWDGRHLIASLPLSDGPDVVAQARQHAQESRGRGAELMPIICSWRAHSAGVVSVDMFPLPVPRVAEGTDAPSPADAPSQFLLLTASVHSSVKLWTLRGTLIGRVGFDSWNFGSEAFQAAFGAELIPTVMAAAPAADSSDSTFLTSLVQNGSDDIDRRAAGEVETSVGSANGDGGSSAYESQALAAPTSNEQTLACKSEERDLGPSSHNMLEPTGEEKEDLLDRIVKQRAQARARTRLFRQAPGADAGGTSRFADTCATDAVLAARDEQAMRKRDPAIYTRLAVHELAPAPGRKPPRSR